jgi:hypothetical protein
MSLHPIQMKALEKGRRGLNSNRIMYRNVRPAESNTTYVTNIFVEEVFTIMGYNSDQSRMYSFGRIDKRPLTLA